MSQVVSVNEFAELEVPGPYTGLEEERVGGEVWVVPFWAMRSRVEIALWRWPTLRWWIRRWLRGWGSQFGFCGDDN